MEELTPQDRMDSLALHNILTSLDLDVNSVVAKLSTSLIHGAHLSTGVVINKTQAIIKALHASAYQNDECPNDKNYTTVNRLAGVCDENIVILEQIVTQYMHIEQEYTVFQNLSHLVNWICPSITSNTKKHLIEHFTNLLQVTIEKSDICTHLLFTKTVQVISGILCTIKETELTKLIDAVLKLDHVFFESLNSDCDQICGTLLSHLLPALCKSRDSAYIISIISRLSEAVQILFEKDGQHMFGNSPENVHLSERPYLILCGSADIFLPLEISDLSLIILESESFWEIIQSGFFHLSALSRKRSLYLLKRVLEICNNYDGKINEGFSRKLWWNKEYKKQILNIWTDFILFTEVLEEKQVHMITPLMPKLDILIKATHHQSCMERAILHTSWITTLFQRIAGHQTTYIQRWGVTKLLLLEFDTFPLFTQNGEDFLCGPFVTMLTPTAVYHKPADVLLGNAPPIADNLYAFMKMCFKGLSTEKAGSFLYNFINGIKKHFWSGAALIYVVKGLSSIEQAPILNSETFVCIREFLLACTSTLDSYFRGAVQQYFTQFVIQVINTGLVLPVEFASYLALLTSESLKRGGCLWQKLVQWLQTTAQSSSGGDWCEDRLQCLLTSAVEDYVKIQDQDMEGMMRLLLLAVDSDIISIQNSQSQSYPPSNISTLGNVLTPVLGILQQMGQHLYMPVPKAESAVKFTCALFKEAQHLRGHISDPLSGFLKSLLDERLVTSVLQFVSRRLDDSHQIEDIHSLVLYRDFLDVCKDWNPEKLNSNIELSNLRNTCQTHLRECNQDDVASQVKRCGSMMVLSVICSITSDDLSKNMQDFFTKWKICSEFKKPHDLLTQKSTKTGVENNEQLDWGHISTLFLESQWLCLHQVLLWNWESKESRGEVGVCVSVSDLLTAMDILGGRGGSLLYIFKCAELVMQLLNEDERTLLIEAGWRSMIQEKKSSMYWQLYTAYLNMAVQSCTLLSLKGGPVNDKLEWLFSELLTLGEEKLGLVYVLMNNLCDWWQSSPANLAHAEKYMNTILKAITFGEIHCKGKRFENEAKQFLLTFGDDLAVNQRIDCIAKEDCMVRVTILTMLSKLQADIPEQANLGYAISLELLNQQKESLNVYSYRNFGNSLSHRRKHRSFCALMVLHNFLESDLSDEWEGVLHDMLLKENQPSVRCMADWMYIRLLHLNPKYMTVFWEKFNETSEKTPVLMCSLITVLTHLVKLKQGSQQQAFILEVLPKVFPWSTTQQFNIRLFSQSCIIVMWQLCEKHGHEEVLSKHAIIQSFINHCKVNSQAEKTLQRLLSNFFNHLHPFEDLSIETIVKTVPHLTGLTDEEWINPSRFNHKNKNMNWSVEAGFSMPLWNSRGQLQRCEPGTWRVKFSGKDEEWIEQTSDVQKKMVPWRSMLPEQNLDPELQDEYSRKRQGIGEMVLCASLIDKIPNLGGLCRTSEIFGVSEYVLGCMKYVKDKNFESLSVSSHKWLPMKEVRPQYLKTYLLEMKEQGYTLVGAEQTANSVSLTQYAFPLKTLLLLGNEKEGIPVEIIQLLDVCVEIPQQGVVRSLNVHVSGALLVWEYTRQLLLKSAS